MNRSLFVFGKSGKNLCIFFAGIVIALVEHRYTCDVLLGLALDVKTTAGVVMGQNVYRTIKERILFLEYKPSEILNEKTIAQEFGVSRTPVREALKRLEMEQLVRVLPRSGAMVTEIEFEKMMYTYQVRFKIEELVGDLAGEHMKQEFIERFEELRQRCLALKGKKDRRKLVDIDISFRNVLFEAARNPILKMISEYLYNLTLRLWYITLDLGKWSDEVQAMHDEIAKTQEICVEHGGRGLGVMRREILQWHFARIREKYLGMSDTSWGANTI